MHRTNEGTLAGRRNVRECGGGSISGPLTVEARCRFLEKELYFPTFFSFRRGAGCRRNVGTPTNMAYHVLYSHVTSRNRRLRQNSSEMTLELVLVLEIRALISHRTDAPCLSTPVPLTRLSRQRTTAISLPLSTSLVHSPPHRVVIHLRRAISLSKVRCLICECARLCGSTESSTTRSSELESEFRVWLSLVLRINRKGNSDSSA